jgi:uncharacterized protein YozE (UPF0346 family)
LIEILWNIIEYSHKYMNKIKKIALLVLLIFSFCGDARKNKKKEYLLPPPIVEKKFSELSQYDRYIYEAKDIKYANQKYYVIFNNTNRIGIINNELSDKLTLIANLTDKEVLNFDGITHSSYRKFYLISKALEKDGSFFPGIHEFDEQFEEHQFFWTDFALTKQDSGISAIAHITRENESYILGLCEFNFCRTDDPKFVGNGKIQVFKKEKQIWKHIAFIDIPHHIDFLNYSAMDILDNQMVVISKLSSKVWVGKLSETSWSVIGMGHIFTMPKGNEKGEVGKGKKVIYCSIDGVSWVDHHTIALVSNKLNSMSPAECQHKEQMIHIFEVPEPQR